MFAFVTEDPGGKKGERFRDLQRSTARSYCSALGHNKRRKQRLSVSDPRKYEPSRDPPSRDMIRMKFMANRQYYRMRTIAAAGIAAQQGLDQEDLDQSLIVLPNAVIAHPYGDKEIEGRSLQFFWERTAKEWSGWHDRDYWRELALQAMTSQPSVRHALISIAAFHEAVELPDLDKRLTHRSFAMKEAHKALACLTLDHDKMSVSAILTTYVAVAMSILSTGDLRSYKVLQLQFELIDEFRKRPTNIAHFEWIYITRYLEPVIDRLRAKACHYIDPLIGLQKTPAEHFYVGDTIRMPKKFVSTQEAQAVLENVLHWATYTTKISMATATKLSDQAQDLLKAYLSALDEYMTKTMIDCERERCNATLLRLSAKYGYMMIESLLINENDELFFDRYRPLYEEFLTCFRQVLAYMKKKLRVDPDAFGQTELLNVCFGIDGGVITLAGQTALRWCRDPTIRRELIFLLYTSQLREGGEAAQAWAMIAENAMKIEEKGLPEVKTCHDIPLENRVRMNMYRFWFGHPVHGSVQHLQYLVYPWSPTEARDIYLSHGHNCPFEQALNDASHDRPQMMMGKGYLSVLDLESPDRYITIKDPKFYHIIPSV